MKTRMTELFGIKYPIMLAGMSWVSIPEMVAAVSNAGGLGILATGPLGVKETRKSIHRIRELTDKPFGANATLLFPGAKENTKVLLEEEVPVINFSLGKGDWIAKSRPQNTVERLLPQLLMNVMGLRHKNRARMVLLLPDMKQPHMEATQRLWYWSPV